MIPLKDENPTQTFPFFTILFIAANILVFLYQVSLGPGMESFVVYLAAIPYEITHFTNLESSPFIPPPVTLFTSLFIHGGIFHLGGNLLFFWIFGNNIEDAVGHLRFIVFYLLCGLVAGLVQIMVNPGSRIPMVGASGAVSGIMGAYMVLYPRARVVTLIFLIFIIRIVRIPAFFFLFFWFFLQMFNGFLVPANTETGGVAFFAHIGGFITGVILIKFFQKKRKRTFSP